MSRGKVILFGCIVLIFIGFVSWRFFCEGLYGKTRKSYFSGWGVYSWEDLNPGDYDVTVVDGNVIYGGAQLAVGDTKFAQPAFDGEKFSIEGSGKVIFEPAKYKKLEPASEGVYRIYHSGYYKIDAQIPAGRYEVTYVARDPDVDKELDPLVQTTKNHDIQEGIAFDSKGKHYINLRKGEVLEVFKEFSRERSREYRGSYVQFDAVK
ncbi:hypothetical protein PGRAN_14183 [Listeria grandensis FSL F6-0971]|uniref:Uncharacterized protein n=1 Tax=Listeria grandensis FSL F6-0971 TaxID=1265819 RepID=W7BMR3_9LIST|nr:hypothetical protein [Listeria grandensis]EUJ21263.1 hypothetical protein PGRAN_14183 [Listeria grandensis FSL F6-0971]